MSKTIEQVLKSHSSFCYSYSIKGCKCRGCGNATWLECWGACSCCSCFSFLFSIFFHLFTACQCTCQAAVQRFLEKESSCSPAHVLKRRLDDTGIYRVQVTFVQYIFIHIYTYLFIFDIVWHCLTLFDIVWPLYSSVTKLLHRCYIAFRSVFCGCRNALREFLATPSVAKMQSSILSWRCAGRSIEQLLHSAIYFAAVPWSSCFLDVFLMFLYCDEGYKRVVRNYTPQALRQIFDRSWRQDLSWLASFTTARPSAQGPPVVSGIFAIYWGIWFGACSIPSHFTTNRHAASCLQALDCSLLCHFSGDFADLQRSAKNCFNVIHLVLVCRIWIYAKCGLEAAQHPEHLLCDRSLAHLKHDCLKAAWTGQCIIA